MKNIPALDGFRGLAIALVLLFHWFPTNHWINSMPNGPIGVTFFFVLSGFLITSILLDKKEKFNFSTNLKNFLARRALRIFPIYYAVLIGIALLSIINITISTDFYANPIPYFGYFYNHLLEKTGNWSDQLSPYWSLAVEEQFYLFWPLFILLLPNKRSILWMILSFILFGIMSRYYFVSLHRGIGVYTLTCIDCFAWGALLAYCRKEQYELKKIMYVATLPIFLIWIIICLSTSDADLLKILFFRTSTSMMGLVLIYFTLQPNLIAKIMSFSPLRQLGKISYGVYLYHMIVPQLFFILLEKLHIPIPENAGHWLSAIILIGFSVLSYYLLEKPILSLKKYFE